MRVLVLCLLVGCGGTTAASREPDEYTGCGTDESWRAFDDNEAQAVVADATAPSLIMPQNGATLSAATKTKFAWTQDPNDPGDPGGDVPHVEGPGCTSCCPQYNLGQLSTLHLPPISGNAYDLRFFVDGQESHRVITTLQEWLAPDATWASWKNKTVTLKIYRADLLRNDVKQGPYVAATPFTFKIGP
jgi:hypothetical protein